VNASITGFQRWSDFLKAFLFVCGAAWAALVYGLDARYASQEAIQGVVTEMRRDRIDSDIRSIERRIAVVEVQAQATDDANVLWKRQQELILLRADLDDLERDRERLE
jgi:hypothetical protein